MNAKEFENLWNNADNFAEVLAATGGRPNAVRGRAQEARRRGVHMKALPGSGERVYGVAPGHRTTETQPNTDERALLLALDDGPMTSAELARATGIRQPGRRIKRLRNKGLVAVTDRAYHLTPAGVAELDRIDGEQMAVAA